MAITSLNLDDLNGQNGFVINGIEPEDFSGDAVSNAGDINGDGIDDIIIGASGAGLRRIDILPGGGIPNNFDDLLGAGASYVIFGQRNFTEAIDLSDLDGSLGFTIKGADAGDTSGTSVSNAGDINGDGIADLIIGAPNADPNEELSAGASYVVFGQTDIGNSGIIELSQLDGTNGFVINGIEGGELVRVGLVSVAVRGGDRTGNAVSNAGDVNGDGFEDLIIGANFAELDTQEFVGKSYVLFGDDNVGTSGTVELSELNSNQGFVVNGINEFDIFGDAVSNGGDINGDGFDDLIIGAPGVDVAGKTSVGQSYVLFGSTNIAASGEVDISQLNGDNGFVITGIDEYGGAGRSVSNAGDINGDGFADIIIAAPAAGEIVNNYGTDEPDRRGESYVIFGGTDVGASGNFDLSKLDGTNGFVLNGANERDYAGLSVSNAGDINGDGFDDLIIGGPYANPNGRYSAGASYVLFGSNDVGATGSLQLDEIPDLVINGIEQYDNSGRSVSSAGDLNGDGIDDVLIGAPFADANGQESSGQSYVVFGTKEPLVNKITGTPGNDIIDGTVKPDKIHALAGDDRVRGLAGADTINGDAGQDSLFGNNGNDSVNGGKGRDRVLGNNGNDTLSGGNGVDTLFGGEGNDLVFGDAGNDQVIGNGGDDSLFGGADNDILFGYAGEDELFGEAGNDVLWGQANNDFVSGGAGTDVLYGNNGNDVLVGGDGSDSLYGNIGQDSLEGNAGDDILYGNDGNDTLYGGQGNDTLWSGNGNDFLELTRGANVGVDRVKDYQDGVDKFLLSDRFGLGSLEFDDLTISQNGNNAQIKITENNQLLALVENTNAAQLNLDDFISV